MDFEPEDSITYRTFERAFDTHPEECSPSTVCTVEECSSSTVVVGTDDDDCHIFTTESGHNAAPVNDKIDDLKVEDIGEEKGGADERKENVEVEVQEEEEVSKTDEEREEERNTEERRKVVTKSLILYTAQLNSQKEKEHDTNSMKEKGIEGEGEVRPEVRINARSEVEDDDGEEDDYEGMKVEKEGMKVEKEGMKVEKEEMKVEKEGALCNSMSCMSTMLLPYLHDITSTIKYRVSSSVVFCH
jgi:hypothetical protein